MTEKIIKSIIKICLSNTRQKPRPVSHPGRAAYRWGETNVWMLLLLSLYVFVTPLTTVYQASLSMVFLRQEHWSGLPYISPGESSQPREQTRVSCLAGRLFTTESPGKPPLTFSSPWINQPEVHPSNQLFSKVSQQIPLCLSQCELVSVTCNQNCTNTFSH